MDLTPYLTSVRDGVANAAALADPSTRDVAERLATAIESTTRLALIQALADAASTISVDLAPSSVELRMAGPDPEFAVTVHASDSTPTYLLPDPEPAEPADSSTPDAGDEPVARITLRLPQSVKLKVDELATADGISTNAWLVAALTDALATRGGHPGWLPPPPRPPHPPSPAPVFGPHGPFGPHGVFGVNGPFGVGGLFGGKSSKPENQPREARGHVQGWVR